MNGQSPVRPFGATTKRAAFGLPLLAAAALLLSTDACAATLDPYGARDRLVRANLAPTPLYPRLLPGQIGCCDASLTRRGSSFDVVFTESDGQGSLTRIVDFGRSGYGTLRRAISFTRNVQRNPVRRVSIGGRVMYYGRGDISFYLVWHAQGFTYLLSSKYYGGVTFSQLRQMAQSVGTLGAVYDGQTSQGVPVNLYVGPGSTGSPRSVQYTVNWNAACTTGTVLSDGTQLAPGSDQLGADGSFSDGVQPFSYTQIDPNTGADETIAGSMSGRFASDTNVSGTWHVSGSGSETCDSELVTWSAHRTAP